MNETRLKPELTFSVLLNALYGLQKRIVGAGLLIATQYSRAKSGKFACLHVSSSAIAISFFFLLKEICFFYHVSALIQEMQDYLDAKHPSLCVDSDEGNSNDSSSTDGYLAEKTNCNYNRAEEEFNTFESFKRNKYRPKWVRAKSEILSGIGLNKDMEEIIVGPVKKNGKDLPLGKIWETM